MNIRPLVAALSALFVSLPAVAQRYRAVRPAPPCFVTTAVGTPSLAGVVADSDGSLWFAGTQSGRISASGVLSLITGPQLPGTGPVLLTGDKRLCVAIYARSSSTVRCLSMTGELTDYAVGGSILGLAETPDGVIWASEADLSRLTGISRDGDLTRIPLPDTLSRPGALVVDSSGSLWISGSRAIGRLLPGGTLEEHRHDEIFATPNDYRAFSPELAITPDGAVWLGISSSIRMELYRPGAEIVRIGADGTVNRFSIGAAISPRLLRAAADNSLWFVEDDSFISGITLHSLCHLWSNGAFNTYHFPDPPPGSIYQVSASGLAIDAGGTLWLILNSSVLTKLVYRSPCSPFLAIGPLERRPNGPG